MTHAYSSKHVGIIVSNFITKFLCNNDAKNISVVFNLKLQTNSACSWCPYNKHTTIFSSLEDYIQRYELPLNDNDAELTNSVSFDQKKNAQITLCSSCQELFVHHNSCSYSDLLTLFRTFTKQSDSCSNQFLSLFDEYYRLIIPLPNYVLLKTLKLYLTSIQSICRSLISVKYDTAFRQAILRYGCTFQITYLDVAIDIFGNFIDHILTGTKKWHPRLISNNQLLVGIMVGSHLKLFNSVFRKNYCSYIDLKVFESACYELLELFRSLYSNIKKPRIMYAVKCIKNSFTSTTICDISYGYYTLTDDEFMVLKNRPHEQADLDDQQQYCNKFCSSLSSNSLTDITIPYGRPSLIGTVDVSNNTSNDELCLVKTRKRRSVLRKNKAQAQSSVKETVSVELCCFLWDLLNLFNNTAMTPPEIYTFITAKCLKSNWINYMKPRKVNMKQLRNS